MSTNPTRLKEFFDTFDGYLEKHKDKANPANLQDDKAYNLLDKCQYALSKYLNNFDAMLPLSHVEINELADMCEKVTKKAIEYNFIGVVHKLVNIKNKYAYTDYKTLSEVAERLLNDIEYNGRAYSDPNTHKNKRDKFEKTFVNILEDAFEDLPDTELAATEFTDICGKLLFLAKEYGFTNISENIETNKDYKVNEYNPWRIYDEKKTTESVPSEQAELPKTLPPVPVPGGIQVDATDSDDDYTIEGLVAVMAQHAEHEDFSEVDNLLEDLNDALRKAEDEGREVELDRDDEILRYLSTEEDFDLTDYEKIRERVTAYQKEEQRLEDARDRHYPTIGYHKDTQQDDNKKIKVSPNDGKRPSKR